GWNLDLTRRVVFDRLEIVRIYSKPPGREPDLTAPFVMERGGTVEDFAAKVHQDFLQTLKTARIWGEGVYDGQMVGRDHVLHDGDVVELRT
ncbi:MAG: TGS domain-containing protein, partial [Anaerolineae bacterium]